MGGPLVIGYGNVLRGDDGIGWVVAEALRDDPRLSGGRVIACHQLTPELALDVAGANRVVLVDAVEGLPAGSVTVRDVALPGASAGTTSHHVAPSTLAGLALALYGTTPPMSVVAVGAESFGIAVPMSAAVSAALPRIVDLVAELAAARPGEGVTEGHEHRPDGRGSGRLVRNGAPTGSSEPGECAERDGPSWFGRQSPETMTERPVGTNA